MCPGRLLLRHFVWHTAAMKVKWVFVTLVAVAALVGAVVSPARETSIPRYETSEPDIPVQTIPVPPTGPDPVRSTTEPDHDYYINIDHDDDKSRFCRRHWYC